MKVRDVPSLQRSLSAYPLLAEAELAQQKFDDARADYDAAAALVRENVRADEPVALTHSRAQALRMYAEARGLGTPIDRRVAMLRAAQTHYADVRQRVEPGDLHDEADNSCAVNLQSLAQALLEQTSNPQRYAQALASVRESLDLLEPMLARRGDDLRALANLAVGHTIAANTEARQGDFAAAREDFAKARGYDMRMLKLDPQQQVTSLNRIETRLYEVEAELRARTSPVTQLAQLDAIEAMLRALPDEVRSQPESIGVHAWLTGLRAEFQLREASDAKTSLAQRRASTQAAADLFDAANAELARAPDVLDKDSAAIVGEGPNRARAALAALPVH